MIDAALETKIREQIASGQTPILEWIAREHGVSTLDIVRLLPSEHCVVIPDPPIAKILDDLSGWGDLMIIVQTDAIVAEIVSALPPASEGRGYFNFGKGAPFGGHLKQDACQHVAFLERSFAGRKSLAIVFYDSDGESIFKAFVHRDKNRALLTDQVGKYHALKRRYAE
ncbi:MAG: heme utilization cystosolic carrier protein HutX [Pseudomonadota bacterium]